MIKLKLYVNDIMIASSRTVAYWQWGAEDTTG